MQLKILGYVFLGGALGAVTRGFITNFGSDPLEIFIANMVGAFILALSMTVPALSTPERQAFLGSGFAGGFTTFSSLALISTEESIIKSSIYITSMLIVSLLILIALRPQVKK